MMTCIHGTKKSVAEIVEPVDEWRVHEQSNKEKRSQGQGKHHAEKARRKEGTSEGRKGGSRFPVMKS